MMEHCFRGDELTRQELIAQIASNTRAMLVVLMCILAVLLARAC